MPQINADQTPISSRAEGKLRGDLGPEFRSVGHMDVWGAGSFSAVGAVLGVMGSSAASLVSAPSMSAAHPPHPSPVVTIKNVTWTGGDGKIG